MGNINRYRLGLIFNFNPKWMGGIIYLLNISRILNFLEDKDKPELFVFYPKSLKKFVDEIDYPYTTKVEWNFPSVRKGFIKSKLSGKNVFVDKLIKEYKLKGIFPMHDYPVKSNLPTKKVSWYADLQHKYYPEFFSKRKIIERDLRIKYIIKNSKDLVVSSQAVKDDFLKFFKIPKTLNIHIYRFVSIIDELPQLSSEEIKNKYNLPKEYYMISNQFHKHKNHKVVLKALVELKNQGKSIHIVMTGKFPDKPESPYMEELHELINTNDLKEDISFLGLIPRGDQLLLMSHAKAILQPSLFEGWSTVIEDARSLQVPVIAADLSVNIEQLSDKGKYFSAHDYVSLSKLIIEQENIPKTDLIYEPYDMRMKEAAYSFYAIFEKE